MAEKTANELIFAAWLKCKPHWAEFSRAHPDGPSYATIKRWEKAGVKEGKGQVPHLSDAEVREAVDRLIKRRTPTSVQCVRWELQLLWQEKEEAAEEAEAPRTFTTFTDQTLRRTLRRVGCHGRAVTTDHYVTTDLQHEMARFQRALQQYLFANTTLPPYPWGAAQETVGGGLVQKVAAGLFCAFDETSCLAFETHGYAPVGAETVAAPKTKHTATVVPIVSANGELVHNAIIFSGSTLACAPTLEAPGISTHFTTTGWITVEVMAEIAVHVAGLLDARRRAMGAPPLTPAVLLGDCHISHTALHLPAVGGGGRP